jgi:hypothetical protein
MRHFSKRFGLLSRLRECSIRNAIAIELFSFWIRKAAWLGSLANTMSSEPSSPTIAESVDWIL